MNQSELDYDKRHQIILPAESNFTKLIARSAIALWPPRIVEHVTRALLAHPWKKICQTSLQRVYVLFSC